MRLNAISQDEVAKLWRPAIIFANYGGEEKRQETDMVKQFFFYHDLLMQKFLNDNLL